MVNLIDYVLVRAGKFGGRVFGGYVRDVMVPIQFNPKCPTDFKDVDVWFQDMSAAVQFIVTMQAEFTFQPGPPSTNGLRYECNRQPYQLILDSMTVWFNLVIADTFPENDFDVNCLTYDVSTKQFAVLGSLKTFVETLQQNILRKQATFLPTYLSLLLPNRANPNQGSCATAHRQHITDRYLRRGWTLRYGDAIFQDGDILHWIRDQSLLLSNRCRTPPIIQYALESVLSELESSTPSLLSRDMMQDIATTVITANTPLVQTYIQNLIVDEIQTMLVLASTFGGAVFGGYVRDVIVPLEVIPKTEGTIVDFRNVDLWFKTVGAVQAFLSAMNSRLTPVVDWKLKSDATTGRQSYDLMSRNITIARVDIYILPQLIVNDFDINCLTCTYVTDGSPHSTDVKPQFAVEWYDTSPTPTVDVLKQRISAKEARLLAEYAFAITYKPHRYTPHIHRAIARGWTIIYNDFRFNAKGANAKGANAKGANHLHTWIQQCDHRAETRRQLLDEFDTTLDRLRHLYQQALN